MRLSQKGKWIAGSAALVVVALVVFWVTGKSGGHTDGQTASSIGNLDPTATVAMVTPPIAADVTATGSATSATEMKATTPGPEAKVGGSPAVGSTTAVKDSAAPAEAKPVNDCKTLTFHHKNIPSHANGEACTHHKNILTIKDSEINSKSVCVRVDGKPVHYTWAKKKTEQLLLGPVAGPEAKITVTYCRHHGKCNEDCTVPKDSFMSALGAEEDLDADSGKAAAHWDAGEGKDSDVSDKIDADVKKELARLDENGNPNETFDGWINESETPACGIKGAGRSSTPGAS